MAGIQCLLTGTNIARYFIWDGIRAFDYLLTRPDVDPKRVGVAGNSGGGTQSSYMAAFEPRLAAAAPSCYLTSWEKLWSGPGPQDAEQNFVNFLKDGLDFPDFLIAFAPKPIQMATATRDFFPIAGAKATFAEAHRIFEVLDAGPHMGLFEFDDTHGWSKPRREATYRWFARWLQGREDDGREPALKLDSPQELQCTQTGQVATSFADAETVQLAQRGAGRADGRRAQGAAEYSRIVARPSGGIRAAPRRARRPARRARAPGLQNRKNRIQPEPGITVPALAFVPSGKAGRKPAVLYVNRAGKAADGGEGGAIEGLLRQGNIVLALDPRGWVESAPPAGPRGSYTRSYQMAMRAFLVGKSIVGMQTGDVLRAFDWLAARPDVDLKRIAIIGKGNGGVLALYAAALEPRIARVASEKAPVSYLSMVQAGIHAGVIGIVVPGVLRDFDLPDVAASLKPRPVWTVTGEQPDYVAWLRQ